MVLLAVASAIVVVALRASAPDAAGARPTASAGAAALRAAVEVSAGEPGSAAGVHGAEDGDSDGSPESNSGVGVGSGVRREAREGRSRAVRGRLVWEYGRPVASERISMLCRRSERGAPYSRRSVFRTGDDGTFEIEVTWDLGSLEGAAEFRVWFETELWDVEAIRDVASPAPGEPLDVGTVHLRRAADGPLIAHGIVVDELGVAVPEAFVGFDSADSKALWYPPFGLESVATDSEGRWEIRWDAPRHEFEGLVLAASKEGYLCEGVAPAASSLPTTIVMMRSRPLAGRLVLPTGADPRALQVVTVPSGNEGTFWLDRAQVGEEGEFDLGVAAGTGWRLVLLGDTVLDPVELERLGVDPGPEGREGWGLEPCAQACRVEVVDEFGRPFPRFFVGGTDGLLGTSVGPAQFVYFYGTSREVRYLVEAARWGTATVEAPAARIVSPAPFEVEVAVRVTSGRLARYVPVHITIAGPMTSEPSTKPERFSAPVVDGRAVLRVPFAGEWSVGGAFRLRPPVLAGEREVTRHEGARVVLEPGRPATVEF